MGARMNRDTSDLVASLADLDAELAAGELSPEDHAVLREVYQSRLEAMTDASVPPRGPSHLPAKRTSGFPTNGRPGPERSRPRARRSKWLLRSGIASLLAGAGILAFFLVAGDSSTRLPGESASGSISLSTRAELRQALVQAKTLEVGGDYAGALKLYGQILHKYPGQPEALAYSGWIEALAGEADHGNAKVEDTARADEEAAAAVAPSYPDARYFLGAVLFQDFNDPNGAVIQFRAFLGLKPSAAFLRAASPTIARAFAAAGQPVPAGLG